MTLMSSYANAARCEEISYLPPIVTGNTGPGWCDITNSSGTSCLENDYKHIYSISPLPYSSKMDLRNSIYEKISHLNINDHDKSDVTASFIAMNMLFVTEDMIK